MKNQATIVNVFTVGILVSSLALSPFALDYTLLARFMCCAALAAITFYFCYRFNLGDRLQVDLVLLAYFTYVAFCCVTVAWAQNKAEALFSASKISLSLAIFLLSCFCLKQNHDLFISRLQKISVLLFYITFLSALVQYSFVKTSQADWHYLITGINGHKNLYASFLFLNLFFLIGGCLQLTRTWRIFALLAFVLSIGVIIFLRTKAVWLGMGAGLFTLALAHFYKPKQKALSGRWYVVVALCLVVANVFFLFLLQPLVQSGINYANLQSAKGLVDTERLLLWDKTYTMIVHHTLFGTGLGNWQVYFPDATLSGLWRAEDLNYTFQRPHNDFLWILSETGLVGFNLFLAFLISVLVLLVKTVKRVVPEYYREVLLCLAFITGYYIISFFDFPMERMEHLIWINILLGIAYYRIRNTLSLKPLLRVSVVRPYYAIAVFLCSGILLLGVLRYNGELNVRRMYDAKNAGNVSEIIKAGQSAKSLVYTLDPTSVPIDWYIGNAHAAMGNYAEAHRDFLKACVFNPFNRNGLNDMASSYSMNHQQDSAKIFYREASRISPRFDDPKLNLAAIYIREGNYQMASECLASLYHNSERRTNYQKIVDLAQKK